MRRGPRRAAWGNPDLSPDVIQAAYLRLTPGWFMAHSGGEPAGAAGFALVGFSKLFEPQPVKPRPGVVPFGSPWSDYPVPHER
jgi:hypothetical protein